MASDDRIKRRFVATVALRHTFSIEGDTFDELKRQVPKGGEVTDVVDLTRAGPDGFGEEVFAWCEFCACPIFEEDTIYASTEDCRYACERCGKPEASDE